MVWNSDCKVQMLPARRQSRFRYFFFVSGCLMSGIKAETWRLCNDFDPWYAGM